MSCSGENGIFTVAPVANEPTNTLAISNESPDASCPPLQPCSQENPKLDAELQDVKQSSSLPLDLPSIM